MNRSELKEETKVQLDRIAEFGDGPLEFETRFVEAVIRETEFLEFARNMIDSAIVSDLESLKEAIKFREVAK